MSKLSELLSIDWEALESPRLEELSSAFHAEVRAFLDRLRALLDDPSLDTSQCAEKVVSLVREYGLITPCDDLPPLTTRSFGDIVPP